MNSHTLTSIKPQKPYEVLSQSYKVKLKKKLLSPKDMRHGEEHVVLGFQRDTLVSNVILQPFFIPLECS